MSRQYRSFDALEEQQHKAEVFAVHYLESGMTVSGSLDGDLKIWSTSSDGAYENGLTHNSPHKGVSSISSSSKSGKVLTSDLLGMVALWNVFELDTDVMEEEEQSQYLLARRPGMQSWEMEMYDHINITEGSFTVNEEDGTSIKQKATTCHVTQIHPTGPIFAATGAWAGASIYACPQEEGDTSHEIGAPLRYISDNGQFLKHGRSDKAGGAFGRSISFNQEGSILAVGADKGTVSLYDVETGSTLAIVRNHPCPIRAIAFTQTREMLVGSDQCSIKLYDLRMPQWLAHGMEDGSRQHFTESYVDTLKGHDFWITDVKVASDNRHVATSSADGQLRIWDIRGRPSRSVVFQTKEERPVWSLSWKQGAGASSFVTGSGSVVKSNSGQGTQTSANVRWYQISGSAT